MVIKKTSIIIGFIFLLNACTKLPITENNNTPENKKSMIQEFETHTKDLFSDPELSIHKLIPLNQNSNTYFEKFEFVSRCKKGNIKFHDFKTTFEAPSEIILAQLLPLEPILRPVRSTKEVSCFLKLKANQMDGDSIIFDFGEKSITDIDSYYQFDITDESFQSLHSEGSLDFFSSQSSHYRFRGLSGEEGSMSLLCDDFRENFNVPYLNNFNLSNLVHMNRVSSNKSYQCRLFAKSKNGKSFFSREFRLLYPIKKKKRVDFSITHSFDKQTSTGRIHLKFIAIDNLNSQSTVYLSGLTSLNLSSKELVYLIAAPPGQQIVYSKPNPLHLDQLSIDGLSRNLTDKISFKKSLDLSFSFKVDCKEAVYTRFPGNKEPIPMQIFSGISLQINSLIKIWQSYLDSKDANKFVDSPKKMELKGLEGGVKYIDLFPQDSIELSKWEKQTAKAINSEVRSAGLCTD